MLPLLTAIVVSTHSYTITEVDQRSYFAGRLGQRVETRIQVQDQAGTRWITMPRQHTRAGKIRNYTVGSEIRLP